LITHFSLMEIAFKIVLSRLTLESTAIEGVDRAATEKEITSIKDSLQVFRSIKTAANNIRKDAEKITGHADRIKVDISNSLEVLSELVLSVEEHSHGN